MDKKIILKIAVLILHTFNVSNVYSLKVHSLVKKQKKKKKNSSQWEINVIINGYSLHVVPVDLKLRYMYIFASL